MQKQNSLLSRKRSKDKPLRKKSSKNIRIKGPWSSHEDQLLMKWIEAHGPKNWARCAETIKGRNGKQCREHWNNSLNYNIIKGQWSTEEDLFIMVFYDKLDKSWKKMIPLFKTRTENAIKNRFFSQLRKITAKFVKKDKSEYNSKFKLGTLIKYYNKGVEEAKNDFLKDHPMTEDNYNAFIKDVENLINNKPKEQKFINLDNVEKKYFQNLTDKDNNNSNKDDGKDDNNDINISQKDENKKNEKDINISVVKEIDVINIKKENDDNENENKENDNKENKETNNKNEEEFDDDKDSISAPDFENKKAEVEKNNNENNNRNDFKKNNNNEMNKSENKGINTNINSTAFYQNIPINKIVSNNMYELKRNLSIDINKINNMYNLIGQNPNNNNNFNNNYGCNNYYYNIYNNNNFVANNNTFNTIKENNNLNNINNYAFNNIVNNKIIINNDNLKPEQNNPNPIYTKKPSDLNEYFRNNSYKNYILGRSGYFPNELDTFSPYIRYNSNSIFDYNNNSTIYGSNSINNNYYNYFRTMNSNTDYFNFDKQNFISKDSGLINPNPFKRSDSTDIKNLKNYPYNVFGYKRSTSFGSNKDVKFFENFNNDEISKQ